MGIGMVLAVEAAKAEEICGYLNKLGEKAVILGEVVAGEGVIL
ncbi:MAG: hypothetical protein EOM87_04690 [Clostridia bacterium]|nr:hypothetical protein [Clostridia bacterium]